jgi:hypothetical protein
MLGYGAPVTMTIDLRQSLHKKSWIRYNVGKTIRNHPPNHHFDRWYGYDIVLPTLFMDITDKAMVTNSISWDLVPLQLVRDPLMTGSALPSSIK